MTRSLVEEAIQEHWGERCPDFEPGCPCCRAWAEYDDNERLREWNREIALNARELVAEIERLRAALEDIAAAKPQQIGDTGFQQGPLSLWMWAKRTARAVLEGKHE